MPTKRPNTRVVVLLVILQFGGLAIQSVQAKENILQSQKDREWAAIAERLRKGEELRAAERNNQDLVNQRMIFFQTTGAMFRRYIDKYVAGSTAAFVIASFRLGDVWIKAGDDHVALVTYTICDSHPMKDSVFYPKDEPLAPKIKTRINEVRARLRNEERAEEIREIRIKQ